MTVYRWIGGSVFPDQGRFETPTDWLDTETGAANGFPGSFGEGGDVADITGVAMSGVRPVGALFVFASVTGGYTQVNFYPAQSDEVLQTDPNAIVGYSISAATLNVDASAGPVSLWLENSYLSAAMMLTGAATIPASGTNGIGLVTMTSYLDSTIAGSIAVGGAELPIFLQIELAPVDTFGVGPTDHVPTTTLAANVLVGAGSELDVEAADGGGPADFLTTGTILVTAGGSLVMDDTDDSGVFFAADHASAFTNNGAIDLIGAADQTTTGSLVVDLGGSGAITVDGNDAAMVRTSLTIDGNLTDQTVLLSDGVVVVNDTGDAIDTDVDPGFDISGGSFTFGDDQGELVLHQAPLTSLEFNSTTDTYMQAPDGQMPFTTPIIGFGTGDIIALPGAALVDNSRYQTTYDLSTGVLQVQLPAVIVGNPPAIQTSLTLEGSYDPVLFVLTHDTITEALDITYDGPAPTGGETVSDQYAWRSGNTGGLWTFPGNWENLSNNTVSMTYPGSGDGAVVDGQSGTQNQILGGPGTAASLALIGNSALEGAFTITSVTFGSLSPPAPYSISNAVDIEAATSLATASTQQEGNVELDGPGAVLTASTSLNVSSGALLAVYDAAIQAASCTISSATLNLDGTATAEIGTAGDAQAGLLTVDPGATLTVEGSSSIDPATIDDGTILAAGNAVPTPTFEAAVSGSGTIIVEAAANLSIAGSVTGLSAITVDTSGNLSAGDISQTGPIQLDGDASLLAGSITDTGAITLGTAASASVSGNLTGLATVSVGEAASLSVSGTVAGLAGISLAAGSATQATTLNLAGVDTNVPISLAGDDLIKLASGSDHDGAGLGTSIDGAVSGFDSTDAILNTDVDLSLGGHVITAATYFSSGTLSLSQDGTTIETLLLGGSYSAKQFISDAVGLASGESVVSLVGAAVAPVAAGGAATVTGAASNFGQLQGNESYSSLAINGAVVLEGTYQAAAVTVGAALVAGTLNALDIEAGATLAATQSATIDTNLQLSGAGADLTDTGALTIGGAATAPQLYVMNGATVTAAALDMVGSDDAASSGYGDTSGVIYVDPAATVEIGTSGGAAVGALTVDAGATITGEGLNETLAANVVDNGSINVAAPLSPDIFLSDLTVGGNLTGTGSVSVSQDQTFTVVGSVNGLSAISIAASTSFTVYGSLTSSVALSTGTQSTAKIEGNVTGLASLTVGQSARFEVDGTVSDSGAITLLAGAAINAATTATFNSTVTGSAANRITLGTYSLTDFAAALSGYSQIAVAGTASLELFGAESVPITLAGEDLVTMGDTNPIAGAISGFDTSDEVRVQDGGDFTIPGDPIITAATFDNGTLALTDDGILISSLTLEGNYAGLQFIADAADTPTGVSEITLAGGSLAPIANAGNDPVSGGQGTSFLVQSGTANAASLSFTGNTAIDGQVTTGSFTVGTDSASADSLDAVDVEAGGRLAAASASSILSYTEVDGAGAALTVAGSLTLGGGDDAAELLVLNGAAVQVDSLTLTGSASGVLGSQGSSVFLDPTATVEVGTAGGAGVGTLTIDPNAVLTLAGLNATVNGPVEDNGTIDVDSLPTAGIYSGSVTQTLSGTGQLVLGSSVTFSVTGGLSGLSGISTGSSAGLTFYSTTSNVGPISIGTSSAAQFSGDVTGLGLLQVGTGGAVTFDGNVTGVAGDTGRILLGTDAVGSVAGAVADLSQIVVGQGGTLSITGSDVNVPITLQADTELQLGQSTHIGGTISGFAIGDTLNVLDGTNNSIITGATYTATGTDLGNLSLTDNGVVVNTLALAGDYAGMVFLTNAAGVVASSNVVAADAELACFAAGTRLRTPGGEVAVEHLAVGDLLLTVSGTARPIRWIGQRHLDCRQHPNPRSVLPIRIAPHTFGWGRPVRRLLLSPDHAVFLEGVLIPVKHLNNGSMVNQLGVAEITYYHVELDRHEVVLAEGLPAETYLDTGNRSAFANNAMHRLPPDVASARWESFGYAPLMVTGPEVRRAREMSRLPRLRA